MFRLGAVILFVLFPVQMTPHDMSWYVIAQAVLLKTYTFRTVYNIGICVYRQVQFLM
jgi:hypothetical protein